MPKKRKKDRKASKKTRQRSSRITWSELYEVMEVNPFADLTPSGIAQSGMSAEDADLARRIAYLSEIYGGSFPRAAVYLDEMADKDYLPVMQGDDVKLIPIAGLRLMTAHVGGVGDPRPARDSLHELHRKGLIRITPNLVIEHHPEAMEHVGKDFAELIQPVIDQAEAEAGPTVVGSLQEFLKATGCGDE